MAQLVPPSGQDWFGLLKLPAPADYAQITLQFGERRPQVVWHHEGIIDGLVRPGAPVADQIVPLDASGCTAAAWSDLSAGMSYGLALGW